MLIITNISIVLSLWMNEPDEYENTYRMNGSIFSMPRLASSTLLLLQGLNKSKMAQSNPKQGTQIVE